MKRFLALLIVLVMTSAASAAYMEITVNDEAYTGQDVEYSDIIKLKLMDDRGTEYLTGTISSVSYIDVDNGDEWAHTWYATPMGGWAFTAAGDGYDSSGTAMWINGYLPEDGVIFTHEFHVPDLPVSTEIVIDYEILYSINGVSGSETLHVIPEPATIALLGLGGLFLRRRKK